MHTAEAMAWISGSLRAKILESSLEAGSNGKQITVWVKGG
jgi:hypothetical protein